MNKSEIVKKLETLTKTIEELKKLVLGEESSTANRLSKGPLYNVDPGSTGFHILKDKWCQRSYIYEHCHALLGKGVLEKTISATRCSAHARTAAQGFIIGDEQRKPKNEITEGTERWWEAKLYEEYKGPIRPRVDVWHAIVARQVPLYSSQMRGGWGEIDLLAVGKDWCPAVVELKLDKKGNNESPQRPLFEAVGYALALQECWVDFRPEFDEIVASLDGTLQPEEGPKQMTAILLAPKGYWDYWLDRHDLFTEKARSEYARLIKALSENNIVVRIAQMENGQADQATHISERNDFPEE